MKIYVQANSKADLNRRLDSGETIEGCEYNAFNPNGYRTYHILDKTLPEETIIAIFKDRDYSNTPIGIAWGNWKKGTVK